MSSGYVSPAVVAGLEYTPPTERAMAAVHAAIAKRDAPDRIVLGPEASVANHDGEVELLPGGAEVTHRFVEGPGDEETVLWHYVEGGPRDAPTVVFLHGIPDSWYLWHHQINDLSADHRVIAVDLKGYGQSDKRPGDYRQEGVAEQFVGLLDRIGIERAGFVTHDRGTPYVEHLAARHPERVDKFVRGEQHCYYWHPDVSPQARWFSDPAHNPFSHPEKLVGDLYSVLSTRPVPAAALRRTVREAAHPGIAMAVPRYFQANTFRKEWIRRHLDLIPNWRCPILILQGYEDPFQPYEYFENLATVIPNSTVEFVAAGHYFPHEAPAETTGKIAAFLAA